MDRQLEQVSQLESTVVSDQPQSYVTDNKPVAVFQTVVQ